MRRRYTYDSVLKDLFERDHPSLLEELTGGVPIQEFLNVELPKIIERRVDCVARLADGTLSHIEFQSQNHRRMPYRQGIYGLLLADKFQRKVAQTVIYLGKAPMKMRDSLDAGSVRVQYRLIDIRSFDAEALSMSPNPADRALAILGRGSAGKVKEIVARAAELKGAERERTLVQIGFLAGLRGLSDRVRMELKPMSMVIDISKHAFLQDILKQGYAKGVVEGEAKGQLSTLRELLELKFGALPRWATQRLSNATTAQVNRWVKKVLVADSVEGVIGRRSA